MMMSKAKFMYNFQKWGEKSQKGLFYFILFFNINI